MTAHRSGQRGQTLVFVAGGIVGLLALAALAVDLSSVYATQQLEKAAADAAALAGAQDLQKAGTQSLGDPTAARRHAMEDLAGRFGISVPPETDPRCNPTGQIVDCPLDASLPYVVSVSTPSKTTGNPRSIQVSVRNPHYQLAFANLFGQHGWDVGETSVARIDYGPQYALVALQPPEPKPQSAEDANLCKDITVDGQGTVLNIKRGDIGTNTSATTTNKGLITLADGYAIDHIDDIAYGGCQYATPDATWSTDLDGNPVGEYIGPSPLLQDPAYPIASFDGAHTFANQSQGTVAGGCAGAAGFPTDGPTQALLTPPAGGTLTCYRPGIYSSKFSLNRNTDIAYLLPGAYRFDGGMKMGGTLAGGMIDDSPGVVLVFPQSVTIDPNNAIGFLLNSGSADCDNDECRAQPAVDFAGNIVKTPGGLTITIEVPRDEDCFKDTDPISPIPAACSVNQNNTVSLAGNALFTIGGVLYGPSDNMQINASVQNGFVGQILSWTVKYAGGATLNQDYPGRVSNAVVRLDRACSGLGTPCTP